MNNTDFLKDDKQIKTEFEHLIKLSILFSESWFDREWNKLTDRVRIAGYFNFTEIVSIQNSALNDSRKDYHKLLNCMKR